MQNRDRFDQFTERARKVLSLAQEEAQRFQHNYIGTEHLLLGLLDQGEGVAIKVLTRLGVSPDLLRGAIEGRMQLGDQRSDAIGLTPRARRVIDLAV
ncbi:MAG TPA: Clp protease N-terminal domain-containing protein, partial [Chthonomonadales bacterium]|nr:Clp protease N-terminal domain-containing protein [Chthonomonadales bacterium]